VACRRTVVTQSAIGIVELGDACARLRARNLDLFEMTGGWVATTPPGVEQRHFATAAHRHAWHAELWARRCPAIPPVDLDALTARHRVSLPEVEPGRRLAAYRARLDTMSTDLDSFASAIDSELDPSTVRVIDLVRSDLAELASPLRTDDHGPTG
jgi:hypothetical protein